MKIIIFYIRQILFILFSFWGNNVYSHTWISLNNSSSIEDYSIKILESNATVYKAQFTIHGFTDNIVTKKNIEYHLLSMSSGSYLTNVGEPQLPTISQLIALPGEANYNITISEGDWKDIDMGIIYPVQHDYKEKELEPKFEMSNDIYQDSIYKPNLVKIGEEQIWRNIRNVCISVCPFRYSTKRRKLSVLSNFILEISFSDMQGQTLLRYNDKVDAINWHLFANDISSFPTTEETDFKQSRSNDYDYLIIVGNNPTILNSQALNDFQKWKAFKGYKTKVVSTTTIGSTPNDIKNYIVQEHSNNNINYVLFIGDNDKIPLKEMNYNEESVGSDYWYGCFNTDSNYQASIPIGRFSTNSLTDFQNMIDKTINYESSYNGNFQKILLVAHKEYAPNKYQECSECIRTYPYLTSLNFSTAYGASSAPNIGGNDATNSQVLNYINTGMHIVNYRGHGEDRHWGIEYLSEGYNNRWNTSNELFEGSQVEHMDKCAIFFNVCCQTGSIDDEPCMMESLTRSSEGAIACLAATEDTYTIANHDYNKYLFKNLFNNFKWNLGNLNIFSHADAISTQNAYANYNALASICGGDPTLEIWTGSPVTFTDVSLNKSENNIIVSSPSFSYGDIIAIVSEDGELMNKYVLLGNSYTFSIPSINFYIVLNKHNYIPYLMYVNVTDDYIQNKVFYNTGIANYYIKNATINVGYDVTTSVPYGSVSIENGSKLTISKNQSVLIKNGFECKLGGEFQIK